MHLPRHILTDYYKQKVPILVSREPSRCDYVKRLQPRKISVLLRPNLHGLIISKSTGRNHILSWVTRYWYNSVCVTFQLLNYFPRLKLPQVDIVILRTTYNILAICYRKCWRNAVLRVDMAWVRFQKFACRVVPESLQNKYSRIELQNSNQQDCKEKE